MECAKLGAIMPTYLDSRMIFNEVIACVHTDHRCWYRVHWNEEENSLTSDDVKHELNRVKSKGSKAGRWLIAMMKLMEEFVEHSIGMPESVARVSPQLDVKEKKREGEYKIGKAIFIDIVVKGCVRRRQTQICKYLSKDRP